MKPSTTLLIAVGSLALNFTGVILWSILSAWTLVVCHGFLFGISLNVVFHLGRVLDEVPTDA